MRLARVELYDLRLPFAEPFIISGGRIDARRSVVVVLHDDEGHVGYGEAAPDELPFYSEETLGSARGLYSPAAWGGECPVRRSTPRRRGIGPCGRTCAAIRSPGRGSRPPPGTSRPIAGVRDCRSSSPSRSTRRPRRASPPRL